MAKKRYVKRKVPRGRNAPAKVLASGLFRQRRVPSAKIYDRKRRRRGGGGGVERD